MHGEFSPLTSSLNLNKKFNYLEYENGLLSIEFLILNELFNYKDGIEAGLFFGLMISKYDLLDIRKLKNYLKNLCFGEIPLVIIDEINCNDLDISNIKFTNETLKLSNLGYFVIELKINENINFPLSLIRSRFYDFNKNDNILYKNISLDRNVLVNYLTDESFELSNICFSKELGYSYLNEFVNIDELLKNGKCSLKYSKSYSINYSKNEYLLYDNLKSPISYKSYKDLLNDIESNISINYLFLSDEGEVVLKSLEKLLIELKELYLNLNLVNKNKLLKILKSNYIPIEYKEHIDCNLYRIIYSYDEKKIHLLNNNEFLNYNLNTFDTVYNFDLNFYDYYVVYEDSLRRLDLSNLHFYLNDTNILGLLSLPLLNNIRHSERQNIFYLVNEDGEIKAVKSEEFRLRNKQVRLKNNNSKRIIKVFEFCNIDLLNLENLNKGILLISKNGYIKILNLLEYKIKNKSSQYVMGINLEEFDELIHVSSLDLRTSNLDIYLNNNITNTTIEIHNYDVINLLSSKINKGKKLKSSLDLSKVEINIKINLIGE